MIRIAVVGPECTGKTTLCRDLAAHYVTTWAPEYLREWVDEHPGSDPLVGYADTVEIATRHAAREDERAAAASRVVFFDTDALMSQIYSAWYFGRVHADLAALAKARRPDHTLLLAPDVPWIADGQRDLPEGREAMFQLLEDALADHKRKFDVISGDWANRTERAKHVIDGILGRVEAPADPR